MIKFESTLQQLLFLSAFTVIFTTFCFSQNSAKMKYVRISVFDEYGRIPANLKPENFVIEENKTPQKITYFDEEKKPAAVVILIDKKYFPSLSAISALRFIQKSNKNNDYAIVGFDDEIEELADWKSNDETLVLSLNKIANSKSKNSSSIFFDAVNYSLEKLAKSNAEKKILLVFADDYDRKSKTSISKLTNLIKSSSATIYGIDFIDYSRVPTFVSSYHETFDKLTTKGGGKVYDFPYSSDAPNFRVDEYRSSDGRTIRREVKDLPKYAKPQKSIEEIYDKYLDEIIETIERTYLLGYIPSDSGGKQHEAKIKIKVNDEKGKKLSLKFKSKEFFLN